MGSPQMVSCAGQTCPAGWICVNGACAREWLPMLGAASRAEWAVATAQPSLYCLPFVLDWPWRRRDCALRS
jgi:hypothetical protein